MGYGISNRVVITNDILVRSVNGPTGTVIRGEGPLGSKGVRCVWITAGVLEGFTLSNGCTRAGFDASTDYSGGGAYAVGGTLSNCVICVNAAFRFGGGVYGGTLYGCTLRSNSVTYAYGIGGGVCDSALENSTLSGNYAKGAGGGAFNSVLLRCAVSSNLTDGGGGGACESALTNCTLEANSAYVGGGVQGGSLRGCLIARNVADVGGGAYVSTLRVCALSGNSAGQRGGGAEGGTLQHCTLSGNSARLLGGGAYVSTLRNCIAYENHAAVAPNVFESTCEFTCTTPLQPGDGNVAAPPRLVSASHIAADSPCKGTGSPAYATDADVDGEPWGSPPSMGCDEPVSATATGALQVAIRPDATTFADGAGVGFSADIAGRATANRWQYGDGVTESNLVYASHAWGTTGEFAVVLTAYNASYPGGVSASVTVTVVSAQTTARYVWQASPSPGLPFGAWSNAAHTIQEAVDAQTVWGGLVVVTNGTYESGASPGPGAALTNRVVITNSVRLRSVNGPTGTVIRGRSPGAGGAIRCVYMSAGTVEGLTLSNGWARVVGGTALYEDTVGGAVLAFGGSLSNCILAASGGYEGGGAFGAVLRRCVLFGNYATNYGGGAFGGTLRDCVLSDNVSGWCGGGADAADLANCTLAGNSAVNAGGADDCTLESCTLAGNVASDGGGGAGWCTLVGCAVSGNSATNSGGGVYDCTVLGGVLSNNWCASSGGGAGAGGLCTLRGCLLVNNSALYGGGACGTADSCLLVDCTLSGNSATNGGGVYGGTLSNCTITANTAHDGGGAYGETFPITVQNSIVCSNRAPNGANLAGWCAVTYSCSEPPAAGEGNIGDAPRLVSFSHIAADSPCRGTGSAAAASGTDIDGEAWLSPPSMGCDEVIPGAVTGTLRVAIRAGATNFGAGATIDFAALIDGRVTANRWQYGDGVTESNAAYVSHAWATTGKFAVVLTACNESYPAGIRATQVVTVVSGSSLAKYVWQDSPHPGLPFGAWSNAAHTIQEAVDAQTVPGGWVIVTNGTYETGAAETPGGTLSNRVAIAKEIRVVSVNGPAGTVILGQGPLGDDAVRCVYLSAGILDGFTLSNGFTRMPGASYRDNCGGGAFAVGGTLSNCTLAGNTAWDYGGGAYGGTLRGCLLAGNTSQNQGGGAYGATLTGCTLEGNGAAWGGGGVAGGPSGSTLWDCTLSGNSADTGGGSYGGTLQRCTLSGNHAVNHGGGASDSTLENCPLKGNSATYGGGSCNGTLRNCTISSNSASAQGGGTYGGTVQNCIVYHNDAPSGSNVYASACAYTCAAPLQPGAGNIEDDPLFMGAPLADLHLPTNSPCVDKGSSDYMPAGTDRDGVPRPMDGDADGTPVVDMGAYEAYNADGDSDGDRFRDGSEIAAGTDPLDPASLLAITGLVAQAGGKRIYWHGGTAATQVLERCISLKPASAWIPLVTNRPPTPPSADYFDAAGNVTGRFYRVRIQR